ncbi:uncharacterized protein STEHIDRAFT_152362 [Stereum hirsutum FP-91666 SS1]|uniref:uncharacterized protein n=1 Tax=Stereum hirsutum (strain FP-91666) TaxID=721885 RepID=UPI000440B7B3|nr:uncharacterized protein STEHIDRAFT_152362 [Stereum hirsutum FP-91666 SS1]EIM90651.1 hypothetical protein STEHIDRAFT_152362 [Stereum hirsutum FP-91666 SS1]
MKFFAPLLAVLALTTGVTLAQLGPCYNQADPDNGIGNYCYCEGDGLCWPDAPNGCNPPLTGSFPCP